MSISILLWKVLKEIIEKHKVRPEEKEILEHKELSNLPNAFSRGYYDPCLPMFFCMRTTISLMAFHSCSSTAYRARFTRRSSARCCLASRAVLPFLMVGLL